VLSQKQFEWILSLQQAKPIVGSKFEVPEIDYSEEILPTSGDPPFPSKFVIHAYQPCCKLDCVTCNYIFNLKFSVSIALVHQSPSSDVT